MRLLWAAVILAAVAFGRAQAKVAVDQWTADYLRTERSLWQHIDVQQILVDRGNLLGEIYREHNRTLHKGIGAAATIVRLSDPAKFRPLLDAVRSIESHTVAVSEALAKGDNARVARLLKNSMAEIEQLPETVLRRIGDTAFWTEAMSNHASGQCNKYGEAQTAPNGNELMFDVYKEMCGVSLKAYVIAQLMHMILKVNEEDNTRRQRANDLRQLFIDRYASNQRTVKQLLEQASKRKWLCDKELFPANYHQITRFIQGYVDNEVNLNADKKCSFSCTDFRQTNNFGCHPDTLCAAQHIDPTATRCNGTVYNCEKLDNDLTICPSWQKFQIRRYDFVRSAAGHTLGKNGPCLQTTSMNAWTSWFRKCSNCFCYCDEKSELSDRYFSLHDVKSSIEENRIVTGVAITKRNRMFQFQIAESTLLPFGHVNTTVAGTVDSSHSTSNRFKVHPEFKFTDADITNGVDYHTLTYDHRAINLDTVQAPAGKVVTGVRFHVTAKAVLTLQIRVTDFNFETGRLESLEKSQWISNDDRSERTQLFLDEPDAPIRATRRLEPDFTPNQFVQFGPTARDADAAQVTVPYLDGTFVEGNPSLLAGIGLYYKGQPHIGGFIAPYLIAFDFGSLIEPLIVS